MARKPRLHVPGGLYHAEQAKRMLRRYGGANMLRKPRLYRAGVPCQVIQLGNNREAYFFSESKQGESSE